MRNLSLIECLKCLPAPKFLFLFRLENRLSSYLGNFDSGCLNLESNSDSFNPVKDLNNNGYLDNL